jgi:hypothetical protein
LGNSSYIGQEQMWLSNSSIRWIKLVVWKEWVYAILVYVNRPKSRCAYLCRQYIGNASSF